jgi:putative transposase
MVIAVVLHAANIQDRDGATLVFATLADRFPRLKLVRADGGYAASSSRGSRIPARSCSRS